MNGRTRIEVDSPAYNWLEGVFRPQAGARTPARDISISEHNGRLQFKWGEGTWTTPLSTSAPGRHVTSTCDDPDCPCS